jgi:hypothetical protein
MNKLRFLLLMALAALSAFPAFAQDISGQVVGVSDGDTITVLVIDGAKKSPVKIPFDGIDCPESDQHFGQAAKQFSIVGDGENFPSFSLKICKGHYAKSNNLSILCPIHVYLACHGYRLDR